MIRRLVEVLEVSGSNYFAGFRALFRDVIEALDEAQNIALHLKPLLPIVEAMGKVQEIEVPVIAFRSTVSHLSIDLGELDLSDKRPSIHRFSRTMDQSRHCHGNEGVRSSSIDGCLDP